MKDVGSRVGQDAVFAKAFATQSGANHLRDDGQPAPDRADAPPLAPEPAVIVAAASQLRALPARKPAQRREPFGLRRAAKT